MGNLGSVWQSKVEYGLSMAEIRQGMADDGRRYDEADVMGVQ